jgi:hypothetical protein
VSDYKRQIDLHEVNEERKIAACTRVLEEFDRSKFISEIDNFAKHDL